MRKLTVYNMLSIDGFVADINGDMSWAHRQDAETQEFASENAKRDGVLVFGRHTYDQMASFWPTPMAAQLMPGVAEGMNARQKIVFSRSLKKAEWKGTTVVQGDVSVEVPKLLAQSGPDLTVLGSANLVSQLARAGLVDVWSFLVHPVVLGEGLSPFEGLEKPLSLRRTSSRAFQNGAVLNTYERG